jgi:hypothetical protein
VLRRGHGPGGGSDNLAVYELQGSGALLQYLGRVLLRHAAAGGEQHVLAARLRWSRLGRQVLGGCHLHGGACGAQSHRHALHGAAQTRLGLHGHVLLARRSTALLGRRGLHGDILHSLRHGLHGRLWLGLRHGGGRRCGLGTVHEEEGPILADDSLSQGAVDVDEDRGPGRGLAGGRRCGLLRGRLVLHDLRHGPEEGAGCRRGHLLLDIHDLLGRRARLLRRRLQLDELGLRARQACHLQHVLLVVHLLRRGLDPYVLLATAGREQLRLLHHLLLLLLLQHQAYAARHKLLLLLLLRRLLRL